MQEKLKILFTKLRGLIVRNVILNFIRALKILSELFFLLGIFSSKF